MKVYAVMFTDEDHNGTWFDFVMKVKSSRKKAEQFIDDGLVVSKLMGLHVDPDWDTHGNRRDRKAFWSEDSQEAVSYMTIRIDEWEVE